MSADDTGKKRQNAFTERLAHLLYDSTGQAHTAVKLNAFGEGSSPIPICPLPHTTLSHFPSFRHTPTERAHSAFSLQL